MNTLESYDRLNSYERTSLRLLMAIGIFTIIIFTIVTLRSLIFSSADSDELNGITIGTILTIEKRGTETCVMLNELIARRFCTNDSVGDVAWSAAIEGGYKTIKILYSRGYKIREIIIVPETQ